MEPRASSFRPLARLLAGLTVYGALAACASVPGRNLPPLPSVPCAAPLLDLEIGDAPGRYYFRWTGMDEIAVYRVAPYREGVLFINDMKDARHVSEAWRVDVKAGTLAPAGQDWLDAELARLKKSHWDYDIHVGASALVGLVSGFLKSDAGGNVFKAVQAQPDGAVVEFMGELEFNRYNGYLIIHQDGLDSPELPLGQPRGGYETALLGLQFSPERRYIKTDKWIYDTKDERAAALAPGCGGASGVMLDPAWTRAAVLARSGSRQRLAIYPFKTEGSAP